MAIRIPRIVTLGKQIFGRDYARTVIQGVNDFQAGEYNEVKVLIQNNENEELFSFEYSTESTNSCCGIIEGQDICYTYSCTEDQARSLLQLCVNRLLEKMNEYANSNGDLSRPNDRMRAGMFMINDTSVVPIVFHEEAVKLGLDCNLTSFRNPKTQNVVNLFTVNFKPVG